MEEKQIFQLADTRIANSIEQADKIANQIRERARERIEEFKEKVVLLREKNLERSQYLKELQQLVDLFNTEKHDDSARNEKESEPEQFTGSRNRFIIKAQLDAHLNTYDDNWTKNTHQANGKYTSQKEEEWIAKKQKLEQELANSPN